MTRLYTADCRTVSGAEFFESVFGPREPQEVSNIRGLVNAGNLDLARRYLDAINHIQRTFGQPEIVLPGDLDLTECAGDPLLKRRAA